MAKRLTVLSMTFGALVSAQILAAQALESPAPVESVVPIVVEAGRPLRLALDHRTTIREVGQPVTATLVDPVYVHDRIVLNAGTRAVGHVETLESPSRTSRLRAMLGGDFSAHRRVSVQFDALVLDNGRRMEIRTAATEGVERMGLRVAGEHKRSGRSERFRDTAIRALPYHRQFLPRGTMYTASLLAPLDFGLAEHLPHAPPGTPPAPDSRLEARLLTPLGSATSPRGTPVEAVLTRPLFSTTGAVILPEGARLAGEVTFSKRAGHFRRSGQLRFLLTGVTVPGQTSEPLRASVHGLESGDASRLSIDEEGGVTTTSSPARFATPALAALALAGTFHGRLDFDTDGAGPETEYGGVASSTTGGFIGMSVFGIAVNQIGRPVVIATTSLGLVRSLYATVFARGAEIAFPADTTLQLQISPASFRPAALIAPTGSAPRNDNAQPWRESFHVSLQELTTTGRNSYFILEPGYQLTLAGKDSGETVTLVITVLSDTESIGGVTTRVVEERETAGGVTKEVSRNFFAFHPPTGDVFYFGEDVDTYKHGKLAGHEGGWRHGTGGARYGLMMPGTPIVGLRYYQEHAPRVAMDRAEIDSLTARVTTPAGVFERCLSTKESTPLELFSSERKLYAPGIGLVQDGPLSLVARGYVSTTSKK